MKTARLPRLPESSKAPVSPEVNEKPSVGPFGLESPRVEEALDRLLAGLTLLNSQIESRFVFPDGRRLFCFLDQDPIVNAAADRPRGASSYRVLFARGLVVWADSMAATIATFQSTDFQGQAIAPLELSISGAANPNAALQMRLDQVEKNLPIEQAGFWESVFQTLLLTVYAHEIAHVVCGHVDYAESLGLARRMTDERAARTERSLSASTRHLEAEADFYAGRLLSEFAFAPPDCLPKLGLNTPRENLVMMLLTFGLFTVGLEHEDAQLGARSSNYPTPFLRLVHLAVSMRRGWLSQRSPGEFWEEVFMPTMELMAIFEPIFPEIDLLRDFQEPEAIENLQKEANEILDESVRNQMKIQAFSFEERGR